MARPVRPVWVALAAASAVYFGAFSVIAVHGSAQTTASSPPTAAQAAPFVGDWVATVAMGANQGTSLVSVKTVGGKVTATVTPEGQAAITNTAVAMNGDSLVVRYTFEMQGNTIPTVLSLTPQGDVMRVTMAVMDGQYELTGMAAKQTPGATFPGPQRGGPGAAGGFGGGRGPQTNENTDFTPKTPIKARTGAEEAKGFILPPGYRMELVASDPAVISPGVIEFDGNGRMYVSELVSYMMDANATHEHDPISRISRWESTKGDGVYDKHTIFADHLVAPRMILPLGDGVILTSETDSDDIIKLTDTNGDGVADKREVVFTGIGQSGDANIEHQKAGLVWNLDNWIYTTYNRFRIRWTPTGFIKEPTGPNGGQWGLGSDDDGKPWFVDAGGERGPMNFQFPIEYGDFTPCQMMPQRGAAARNGPPSAAPAPNANCPPGMENGFEKDFATTWPAPSIGDMQGGIFRIRMPFQNLNHFTAATGPAIYRGDALPADLKGQLLFTEPVGRLIRRAAVENIEGLTELKNVYPQSEFITSEDQLFRPVNISNAPDGTLYIADMYHGIIQELQWSGPGSYLRAKIEQYQLDKIASYGRIWRLRYDGRPAVGATDTNIGQPVIPAGKPRFTPPHMYSETTAQLVSHLTDPNGWWRDMAQRLIVLKQDKSVVPALQQMARTSDNLNGRVHALWTLEGLGALDAGLVRELMKDKSPRLRMHAIRTSETLYKAGDKTFADDYRAMTKDPDVNVSIQAMLSASVFKLKDLPELIKATQASRKEKGIALIGDRLLAPGPAAFGGGRGRAPLTPTEQKRLQQGSDIFGAVCFACHGQDGTGTPMEGAPAGTMLAPPLAGSPRVQEHRDYIVKVLLRGLTGPVDGKSYRDVMVPLDNTDEWVSSVASYVRTSFGNSGDLVTPADVARVRAEIAGHKNPWTVPELEASMPHLLDPQQLTLTASHGTETATYATSLRGWNSGVAQMPGMWFQVELTQPARITEMQFESVNAGPGGRGGGRGAAPGAPPPAPNIGYPRAYDVQVSMDGKKWTKVVSGQGEGGRTAISFAPTEAKFVRITQTDNIPNAPAWSIRSLRVYEAKPTTK